MNETTPTTPAPAATAPANAAAMKPPIPTAPAKVQTLKDILEGDDFKKAIAEVLPKHVTAERMSRVGIAAMTRVPALKKCTPASFISCMMTLSQLGLEPDGRNAHIIPYGDTATLVVDYKGYVDLIMRTGKVSYIHADVVREGDDFDWDMGRVTQHKVDWKKEPGKVYAVYCKVVFKDGTEKHEVMRVSEVEAIRSRSKAGRSGPWVTDWNEMAKKTVFKRASKWCPVSSEIQLAIEHEDGFELAPRTVEARDVTRPRMSAGALLAARGAAGALPPPEEDDDLPYDDPPPEAQ